MTRLGQKICGKKGGQEPSAKCTNNLSWREALCLVTICWQVVMARRLPRRAFCTARNDKLRIVIANVVWRSSGKEIASTTPQVWLVAGSHLGFAKTSFHSIASDKNREQVTGKSRAMRLLRRAFCTSRNDKVLRQELRASVCLQNKKEWLVFFLQGKGLSTIRNLFRITFP